MLDVDRVTARAFGFREALAVGVGPFHRHARHQLLYMPEGLVRLETASRVLTLPAVRAALVTAGVEHRVEVLRPAVLCSVWLAAELSALPSTSTECVVFEVSPLLRELFLTAPRFGPEHAETPLATSVLEALARLAAEAMVTPQALALPRARSPELVRATDHLLAHLDAAPSAETLARAAGVSTRTLTRRFAEELGTSLREYRETARMIRAFELLSDPRVRVSDVGAAIGFATPSAFTEAFTRFAGEPPTRYRARLAEPR
ncbi:MAG: helix-turn-helix transcriptional regulator [Sandaracinaceae bacterium]